MAGYNQEFPSRLIADGFTFFCQQHQSAGMSLTFRVSAYSRDRLIGEEIRYFLLLAVTLQKTQRLREWMLQKKKM